MSTPSAVLETWGRSPALDMSALFASRANLGELAIAIDLVVEFVSVHGAACPAPGPSLLAASAVSCFAPGEPTHLALMALANARWGSA